MAVAAVLCFVVVLIQFGVTISRGWCCDSGLATILFARLVRFSVGLALSIFTGFFLILTVSDRLYSFAGFGFVVFGFACGRVAGYSSFALVFLLHRSVACSGLCFGLV